MAGQLLAHRVRSAATKSLPAAYARLVGPDDDWFVERVIARLAANAGLPATLPEKIIIRAVKFVFGAYLHECLAWDGTQEQERAFGAAQVYLLPLLVYKAAGDERYAAELTADAVTASWNAARRGQVHEPGAFLAYLLTTALRLEQRSMAGPTAETLPADDDQGSPGWTNISLSAPPGGRPVEVQVEEGSLIQSVRALVRLCLAQYPQQLRLIEAHMLDRRSIAELAQAWGLTAEVISVTKHRALKHLRNCGPLLILATELGLVLSPGHKTI